MPGLAAEVRCDEGRHHRSREPRAAGMRRCWASSPRQGLDAHRLWPGQRTECLHSASHRVHGHHSASASGRNPPSHAAPVTALITSSAGDTPDTAHQGWGASSSNGDGQLQNLQPPEDHNGAHNTHSTHSTAAGHTVVVLAAPDHLAPLQQHAYAHAAGQEAQPTSHRSNASPGDLHSHHNGPQATAPSKGRSAARSMRINNAGAWLTGVIKYRSTPHELLYALQRYRDQINMIHASAALTHAMQLQQQQQSQQQSQQSSQQQSQQQQQQQDAGGPQPGVGTCPLPQPLTILLLELQLQHLPTFGPRQVANSLWALSKLLGSQPQPHQAQAAQRGAQQVEQLQLQVLTGLLVRLGQVVGQMKPQELANSWYAMACMRTPGASALLPRVLQAASSCWHEFKAQELANMLWATEHMPGLAHGPTWVTWVTGLMRAQAHVVHMSSGNELSYSLWAGARLCAAAERQRRGEPDRPSTAALPGDVFLPGISLGDEPEQHQQQQQVAGAPSGNQLQLPVQPAELLPPDSMQQGQGIVHLHSADTAGHHPGTTSHTDSGTSRRSAHHPAVHDPGQFHPEADDQVAPHDQPFPPQQQQQVPAEAWLAWSLALCTGLQENLTLMGGVQLSQVLSALSMLPPAHSHQQFVLDLLHRAATLAAHRQLSTRAAASLMHAAANLRLQPGRGSRKWAHVMLRVLLTPASSATHQGGVTLAAAPADTAMALYSLALLRCQPMSAPAALLLQQAQLQLDSGGCAPGEVVMMLWSCASLQLRPPPGLLAAFQKASYLVREQLAPREVAALFWALGRLRLRPGRRWLHDVLGSAWRRREEYRTNELLDVVVGLGRMPHGASSEAYDRLVLELQRRCGDNASPEQLLPALCAVARARPASCGAVQWAHDGLVSDLLANHLTTLRADQLTSLLWAAARLARLPSLSPPNAAEGALTDNANSSSSSVGWQDPNTLDTSAVLDSMEEDDVDMEFEFAWAGPGVQQWRHAQDAAGAVLRAVRLAPPSTPADMHSAEDLVDALARGLPAGRLLQGSPGEQNALLALQWQPLRRRKGRLELPERGVRPVLRACLAARGSLSAQQLAVVLHALPQLNVQPSRTWLSRMLFDQRQLLLSFSHHEVALVLFSLGCMRMRPPADWMNACLQQVLDRAPYFTNGGMVSGVLRGLSMLDWSPGAVWMSHFITCVTPVLHRMPPRQLGVAYTAVVDLEPSLAEGWGYHFATLLMRPGLDSAAGSSSSSDSAAHMLPD